ncbi:NCS1 family nucleobase:cation symporter-1 [Myriangium duriaei CBS 260.36]|uniref:NCS1 family nucleobase:cation symporter-1 n=1 Tax=Myriangium duriaei CBS 260.36 TaxID=1168546 RepID=A0A9P4JA64_9PEZI|nr:NCS1 family nucleobase:cation symporter-1 [Myriangium duriaei CBS 260.36]
MAINDTKLAHSTSQSSPSPSCHHDNDIERHAQPTDIEHCNCVPVNHGNGPLARLRELEAKLDRKLGVESEAIVRLTPDQKVYQPWHQQAVMALMWASGTLQISCFATGLIGSQLGLNLRQAIVTTVFGTLFGGMVSAYCATMGPETGLRQVSISRYSFGWWPSKIVAVLNVISQIGWATVCCITGGQALSAVSGGTVSIALGIVIVGVGSLVVSFVGLRGVLAMDKYWWFVALVLILVGYGETGQYASTSTNATSSGASLSGTALSSKVLTLLAVVYGSSASWCSIVSDYYAHYPIDTSKTKVFVLTTLGISLPTMIGMCLGCIVGSAMLTSRHDWADAYSSGNVAYVLLAMLHPTGWAKFSVVLLMLTGIACNCINLYSSALSIQQTTRLAARVPRFFWSLLVAGITIALALAGRNKLLTVIQNLLALLGYWETSFFAIIITEHILFRKNSISNYNLEAWNDPSRLPIGIAGLFAFLVGFSGWMIGMVTTWYIGPVAQAVGGGGDVGNELCLVFTFVAFVPMRYMELKWVGR